MLDKNLAVDNTGGQKDSDQETVGLSLSQDLDEKLQEAISLHQTNQLTRAKEICGQILSVNSQHTFTIHLLGLIAFQENQPQKAAKLIQHAIKLDDTRPIFHRSLGSILQHLGQLQESINAYQRVLLIAPNDHNTWNDIGQSFKLMGKIDQACTHFQNSIAIFPNYPAFYNLGLLMQERGQLEESVTHYKKTIAINPNFDQAYNNLGNVFQEIGQYDEAYSYYQQAIQINPKYFEAEVNLGALCMKMEKLDQATKHFQKALQLNPKYPEAYNNLGLILQQQGKIGKATVCFRRALKINAAFPEAYTNLGNVLLKEHGEIDKAITLYNRAISIDPNNFEAFNNLGYALQQKEDFDQAVKACQKAVEINPNYYEAFCNLGSNQYRCGNFTQSLRSYQRALSIDSDQSKAHVDYSMTLLAMGNFSEGWKQYEWRWKDREFYAEQRRDFPQPLWDGSSLADKSILIWLEQGVGDQIMFASLLPKLQQQARQVLVETGKRLIPIFQRSYKSMDIISAQNPPDSMLLNNSIDFQSPIASLPQWLLPTEASFPQYQFYLKSCPKKTKMLREKYQQLAGGKILIGISWKSTNKDVGNMKIASLAYWESLLSQKDCFFINLQYGDVKQEIEEFFQQTGIQIYCDDKINSLESLDDFAAQVAALDLIISTSNTTVHMAGALGKPVWTLLSYVPGWRWMIDRSDSPWYPSMVLFRQKSIGNWNSVLQSVHDCLRERLQSSFKADES